MEKVNTLLKNEKIKELFKLCKLQKSDPKKVDYILKKFNIDILIKYNRVGGLTLFQYTIYNTTNIKMMDYLYENGGYSENDLQYCKGNSFYGFSCQDSLNWFLQKKLIKPMITVIYMYKNQNGIKTVEYETINTIVYLLASREMTTYNFFNSIKLNFDIYKKDENNNSILDLFRESRIYDNFKYHINKNANTFYNIFGNSVDYGIDSLIPKRNDTVVRMLKDVGVNSKID